MQSQAISAVVAMRSAGRATNVQMVPSPRLRGFVPLATSGYRRRGVPRNERLPEKDHNSAVLLLPIRDRSAIPVPGRRCVFEVATSAFQISLRSKLVLEPVFCSISVYEAIHSVRRASIGSTEAARRAGINVAPRATRA